MQYKDGGQEIKVLQRAATLPKLSMKKKALIFCWYLYNIQCTYSTQCTCTQPNGTVVGRGIPGDNPLDCRINTLDLLNTDVCNTIPHHTNTWSSMIPIVCNTIIQQGHFDWTSLQHCYTDLSCIFVRLHLIVLQWNRKPTCAVFDGIHRINWHMALEWQPD